MGSLVRHSPSSRGTPPAPGHGDTGQCVEDTGVLAAVSGVTSLAGRTPDRAERLWVWRQTRPRGGSAGSCITTKVAAAGSAHHRIRPRGIPGPHRPDTTVVHRVIGVMGSLSELPQVSPGGTVEGGRGDGALGTLRDPYAWGTRSQLQRETFSTRPSAAQGAGRRFAEGRRISQLFSLCLELTLPARHSP